MSGLLRFWQQGDAITCGVAALLLLMSISAWVLIFWKGWLLHRVRADIARAVPAFWSAPSLDNGREQLAAFDREAVLRPLLAAATASPTGETLEARGQLASQLNEEQNRLLKNQIVGFAKMVAAAAGGILGFGKVSGDEEKVLNQIEAAFPR
jgi:biopolymer transport protein ExbB